MPQRIQRKRTKGWKMPEGAVYVGRPTIYGNPFKCPPFGRQAAMDLFRRRIEEPDDQRDERIRQVQALRGKDLACWCPLDQPCHADVLLEIANR
jgi:hypothetical protein